MENMQITVVAPKQIGGTILLPASKSISNRALTINALSGNTKLPHNISDCDDTRVMTQWIREQPSKVDIGAAGTAMRFSTALLAVADGTHIITGTERMKNRPIGVLVDALRQLGANIEYTEKEGFPPLRITGNRNLTGGRISLQGNISSQYISALLMIGPVLKNGLQLQLTGGIVSRPYIDMTLSIMRDFGAEAQWTSEDTIAVKPTGYEKKDYSVENDWSAASYWYEIMALTQDKNVSVTLPNLFANSLQGDNKGAALFDLLGVETVYQQGEVILRNSNVKVERLDHDFVEIPDLAQTFVVTCCMLGIPFHFTGLQSLKIKETDRISALKNELGKLGFIIKDRNDSELLWDGNRTAPKADAAIDTYEDHRMAMAFAPAAITLGSIKINDPHVVSKSYPNYWEDLKKAGFSL